VRARAGRSSRLRGVNQSNGLIGHQPWVELQILTKASASASWKLSFDTGYDSANGSDPPFLPVDETQASGADLYNAVPTSAGPVAVPRFLPLLADYWQSFKASGHAPPRTVFVSDGYTSGVGAQLATARQGSLYLSYRRHYQLVANPTAGAWTFAASGRYPMVCGSIQDTESDTPVSGLLYQDPAEHNYGVPLPAGNYLQIASTTQHETCIYVTQEGLEAVGNNKYESQVTGKLASSGLSDLETNFGVLAQQLGQYNATLADCEKSHSHASCEKPFAQQSEQQFGQFVQVMTGSTQLPARVRPRVSQLVATAQRLTLLFEKVVNGASLNAVATKINGSEKCLGRQYDMLVHDLS
jgi:hypothetical protein